MRTATRSFKHPFSSLPRCHAKVCHLDILVLVEKQIFRFQIAMADVEPMTVINRVNDLLEIMKGFAFG